MQANSNPGVPKPKWFSIKEAADYLEVGEPTLYRWMRDGQITYRKVGDSTRFFQEDLDGVVQTFRSEKDMTKVEESCPVCHSKELVEGHVQSTGLNYFRPKKAKFWTLKDANVETRACMCTRCGLILWFGDKTKLASVRKRQAAAEAAPSPETPVTEPPKDTATTA